MNTELICLSSDEDEPPKKKMDLHSSLLQIVKKDTKDVICLDSDEETDIETNVPNIKDVEKITIVPTIEVKENESFDTVKQVVEVKKSILECDSSSDKVKEPEEIVSDEEDIDNENKSVVKEDLVQDCEASTSGLDEVVPYNTVNLPIEAVTFLDLCKVQLEGNTHADKVISKFHNLITMIMNLDESQMDYFKKFLTKKTKAASESVAACLINFKDVYQYLKSSSNSKKEILSEKSQSQLEKLEKIMQKIVHKLKELDEEEVNFDDDDDSSYIKRDRYSHRLDAVYKKYCKIIKENPNTGRITYDRLNFTSSNYKEINKAICKQYKNNCRFPSYHEFSIFIEKITIQHKLPLKDGLLKAECERCFEKLGDTLQGRRKKELYEEHVSYIMNNEDPAEKDEELDSKLRLNYKEGKVKIEEICEEYVKKQNIGLNDEEINCSSTSSEEESD